MGRKKLLLCAIIGLFCFVHGNSGRLLDDSNPPSNSYKTIVTPYGDIIDCIDIYRQPAFDHPLLKNHTLQMKPTIIPNNLNTYTSSDGAKLASLISNDDICPPETVPIRRTQKKYAAIKPKFEQDSNLYRFAILKVIHEKDDMFYGATTRICAENPSCEDGQSSGASIWIGSDLSDQKNFIKAGWMVNPDVYGDARSHMSIYWTGDGFHKTGCYDLQCPGFIQVYGNAVMGIPLTNITVVGGDMFEAFFYVFQDVANQNWWLVLRDEYQHKFVGYWPKELFPRLGKGATVLHFGGSVSAKPGQQFPPMGDGNFPHDSYLVSNFFRDIAYVNQTNYLIPTHPNVVMTHTDNSDCYRIQYVDRSSTIKHGIYMGGPGGVC